MKRYVQLLVTYVLIALAVVFLYAPWGLALRPSDYSILRAGLSIVCGFALAGLFVCVTYLTLKDPDVKLLEPADVRDAAEVIPVLEEYANVPYVGGIAADALEQVMSATRKQARLNKVIAQQFSEGSLSWDKFTRLVADAKRSVVRNAALIANGVQSFDREGYAKARHKESAELALFDQSLKDMQDVVANNNAVLFEMGKLELELGKLEAADVVEDNSQTVDELRALIENTRYYR